MFTGWWGHVIDSAINQFCTNDLSALYIDITKDSLYCDAAGSERRVSKQFALARVFDVLVKLLAPVLVYTCEEAWEHAGREGSVHEQDFPEEVAEYNRGRPGYFIPYLRAMAVDAFPPQW